MFTCAEVTIYLLGRSSTLYYSGTSRLYYSEPNQYPCTTVVFSFSVDEFIAAGDISHLRRQDLL